MMVTTTLGELVMRKVYGPLMLWPSGNFGDSFVTAGLVRNFASMASKVYLPVRKYNETNSLIDTVQYMFADTPTIEIVEHIDHTDYEQEALMYRATHVHPAEIFTVNNNGVVYAPLWDEQWYTWFNLPFSLRYQNFIVPEKIQQSIDLHKQLVAKPNYILVHKEIGTQQRRIEIDMYSWRNDDQKRLFDDCQIIEITPSLANNMLFYIDLIKNATEIHCAPSSFFCLVDGIVNQTSARLFYHNIRANAVMRVNNQWNNYRWTFVNYATKL